MSERAFSRGVGIVGARALPDSYRDQVYSVVSHLVQRGYHIHSGGALGADQFCLDAVISLDACRQTVIFSPWVSVSGFPSAVQHSIRQLISYGGQVDWGFVSGGSARGIVITGLLERNSRLVRASAGIIAFLHGESRGTRRTISESIRLGRRVVVFLCGDTSLPRFRSGSWVQIGGHSPLSGGFLFLPKTNTEQRQPTMEASGAVRLLQEVR